MGPNIVYMRNIRIGDDNILDFFSTRGGRTVYRGTTGDNLTVLDVIGQPKKVQPKVLRRKKPKQVSETKGIKLKGYNETLIVLRSKHTKKGIDGLRCKEIALILNRVVDKYELKRMYPTIIRAHYCESTGEKDLIPIDLGETFKLKIRVKKFVS